MMPLKDFIILSIITLVVLFITGGIIWMMETQRNELKICANAEGYEFGWADGQMSVPFTAERLNETTIVCCDNKKFITSDGILANGKCIYAFDEVNEK